MLKVNLDVQKIYANMFSVTNRFYLLNQLSFTSIH